MMTREELQGFVPAIVTPFNESGEIMEDAFAEIVDFLIGRGASAICIAGDNGESWALLPAERGRLTRLAKDRVGGQAHVMTGISAPTATASLDYLRAAEENGADALLSMPPTYVLKATDAELARRFETLAAASELPIVLYNSPRRAGVSLDVDQIEMLLDTANIIGIKESNRDFFHHSHLLDRLADRLSVMTGPCHYILPAYALGARGFIATGPEFITAKPSDLARMGTGAPDAAYRRAHIQLTAIYEALMATATWPAAFKAALTLIGLPAGVPRDPVMAATPADIGRLRGVFDRLEIPTS